MKRLSELWFEYLEKRPADRDKFGTILNSLGLDEFVKLLERAKDRNKRIIISSAGKTDTNVPFVEGDL